MKVPIRGRVGVLKWEYYVAADVVDYTVTVDSDRPGASALVATVTRRDRYNLTQRPLKFVAPYKGGQMRWPVATFELTDAGRLTATLGPPEEM